MVLLCNFHWTVLSLSEYFVDWKSGVSSHTFFFACFFDCLCYHLALFSICFYSGPFFFVIYFILWYISFWKAVGLTFVICHPRVLLQQLKISVNFQTSWLQAGFEQTKQNPWAVLADLVKIAILEKKQMWLQGPDEIQMMVVLLPIVVKTLHNVEYWHFLTFNNGVQRALLIECSLVCCLR